MQQRSSCTATNPILQRGISAYIGSMIPAHAGEGTKSMLLSLIHYLQAWKRYGAAVRELSNLNDRELSDIGITRSDIPRLAWEHAHA
jgi:uncharacterized protein YjiS (DUF1127 family)